MRRRFEDWRRGLEALKILRAAAMARSSTFLEMAQVASFLTIPVGEGAGRRSLRPDRQKMVSS
eukprot:5852787-Pyramimonas_sp.AAC.1